MKILVTETQLQTILENNINESTNWGSNYVVYNNNEFMNYLKHVEGIKLSAYDLDDGMITIGYGHAESKNDSNYKVGDRITLQKAEELLKGDVKEKETLVNNYMSDNFPNKDLSILQKQMLTDFSFNPGLSEFPKFSESVVNKDWATTKNEYKRYSNGVELGRNKLFYDTFLSKAINGDVKKTKLSSKDFNVYPNPVIPNNEVTVMVINKNILPLEKITIGVYNTSGRLIDSHRWFDIEIGELKFDAPIDKGVYIININGEVNLKLFVQ